MIEEGRGVALAILGIVAVIAVVGLVLLFTGAAGNVVHPGIAKVYGGVNYGEEFPYLVQRSQGGYPQTAGVPDATYYPQGFYTESQGVALQQDAPFYGTSASGTRAYTSFQRQPYFVPSGQDCFEADGKVGFRCPQGATCIENMKIAEGGNWVPAPAHPCYIRASQE
ncbi:MAG: hypothetical protein QXT19_03380 [Candidatus Woesearchaeota archaeon]